MEISDNLELTDDDREVVALVKQILAEDGETLSSMDIWYALHEHKRVGFWHLRDILATAAKNGDMVWDMQKAGTRHYRLNATTEIRI